MWNKATITGGVKKAREKSNAANDRARNAGPLNKDR